MYTIQVKKVFGLVGGMLTTALISLQKATFTGAVVWDAAFVGILLTAKMHKSSIPTLIEAKQHYSIRYFIPVWSTTTRPLVSTLKPDNPIYKTGIRDRLVLPFVTGTKFYDEPGQKGIDSVMKKIVIDKEVNN